MMLVADCSDHALKLNVPNNVTRNVTVLVLVIESHATLVGVAGHGLVGIGAAYACFRSFAVA